MINYTKAQYLMAARRCVDLHSYCVWHARRWRLSGGRELAAHYMNQAAQHRRNYQLRMQQAKGAQS